MQWKQALSCHVMAWVMSCHVMTWNDMSLVMARHVTCHVMSCHDAIVVSAAAATINRQKNQYRRNTFLDRSVMAFVKVYVRKMSIPQQSGPIKKMPTARSVFPKRKKKEHLIVVFFFVAGLLLTLSRIRAQNDRNASHAERYKPVQPGHVCLVEKSQDRNLVQQCYGSGKWQEVYSGQVRQKDNKVQP